MLAAMRQTSVLLTGAGGAGTIAVIQSLKAMKRYRIITGDASAHAGGYAFADRSYVMPWVIDPKYEGVVRSILAEERPDFVIPLIDEEIGLVHALVAREFPTIKVVAPRPEFCEDMLDKWRMAQRMTELGLSVAKSWLASDASAIAFPAIVKPRVGRGSRGFAVVETKAALTEYLARAKGSPDDFVVQEQLTGREMTTSAVVALGGPLLAVVPKEATVKKGITQVGVTRAIPAVDKLVRDIQERMRADGPFNVQLMLGADGVPKVFEINPRYSTTVALTLGAGLNEVDVVLRHALGEEIPPSMLEWKADVMMVRYTAQAFVDEKAWAPVDRS